MVEEAATVTQSDWWYPGLLIALAIFLLLFLAIAYWGLMWGVRQVDRLNEEIHLIDETQRAFEADMKQRLWGDDEQ